MVPTHCWRGSFITQRKPAIVRPCSNTPRSRQDKRPRSARIVNPRRIIRSHFNMPANSHRKNASARVESAWLRGDLEQGMSDARFVLEMAKVHDDPWVRGEFASWIWRAGGVIEISEKLPRHTLSRCRATGALPLKPGNKSDVPTKRRSRLRTATKPRNALPLPSSRDLEQAPQLNGCVTRCAQRVCAASDGDRGPARTKIRPDS